VSVTLFITSASRQLFLAIGQSRLGLIQFFFCSLESSLRLLQLCFGLFCLILQVLHTVMSSGFPISLIKNSTTVINAIQVIFRIVFAYLVVLEKFSKLHLCHWTSGGYIRASHLQIRQQTQKTPMGLPFALNCISIFGASLRQPPPVHQAAAAVNMLTWVDLHWILKHVVTN
jgi:uncharacterized membrane protein